MAGLGSKGLKEGVAIVSTTNGGWGWNPVKLEN